jgi:transposase-like protein
VARGGLAGAAGEEAIWRYQSGEGSQSIASDFGVTPNAVLALLHRRGVQRRSIVEARGGLSPDRSAEVKRRYVAGEHPPAIAASMGVGLGAVWGALRRSGVPIRTIADIRGKLSKEQWQEAIRRYAEGESAPSVAAAFGVTSGSLYRQMKRRGISRRTLLQAKGNFTETQLDEVIRRYVAGEDAVSLGQEFGVHPNSIYAHLERRGHQRRQPRTYNLREDAFDQDTEEAAYWAGFLCADACVTKDQGSLKIGLAVKDAGHLEKLASFLGTDRPVRFRSTMGGITGKMHDIAELIVCSEKLCASLVRWGVVPNKTAREVAPDHAELNRHWWRGYFDGDGGLCRRSDGYWTLHIIGSRRLMEQFAAFARQHHPTRASVRPQGRVATFQVGGLFGVRAVADVLYEGASVFLDRKFERYQRLVSEVPRERVRVPSRLGMAVCQGSDGVRSPPASVAAGPLDAYYPKRVNAPVTGEGQRSRPRLGHETDQGP